MASVKSCNSLVGSESSSSTSTDIHEALPNESEVRTPPGNGDPPRILICPLTSSVSVGESVPIPTLPAGAKPSPPVPGIRNMFPPEPAPAPSSGPPSCALIVTSLPSVSAAAAPPSTWSVPVGLAVPIPTSPSVVTRIFSSLSVFITRSASSVVPRKCWSESMFALPSVLHSFFGFFFFGL